MSDGSGIQADAQLINRVVAGEERACRDLVDAQLPGLIAFAYRMTRNRAAAEDIAQEAFLRLWRQAPRWKPEAKVSTWLRRVAYNASVDLYRKTRPSDPIDDMPIADDKPNPAQLHQADEVSEIVGRAISGLPERQRAAIAMVHFEGLSNIEAAEVLETSVEAVESLLARGRRSLKGELSDLRADLLEG